MAGSFSILWLQIFWVCLSVEQLNFINFGLYNVLNDISLVSMAYTQFFAAYM